MNMNEEIELCESQVAGSNILVELTVNLQVKVEVNMLVKLKLWVKMEVFVG